MRALAEALGVGPGVTAILGGGGKTTLMETLGRALEGRVLLTTSTKIRRPDHLPVADPRTPEDLAAALEAHSLLCLGSPWPEGKLAAPTLPFPVLAAGCDHLLVEADGSKGLPAKAHAPHEPVIPPEARRVILVLGADAFGRPIREVCHRPERFAALGEASPEDPVTPALAARVLLREGYGNIIYVNKCETPDRLLAAEALAALVPLPLVAGSLREGTFRVLRSRKEAETLSCTTI